MSPELPAKPSSRRGIKYAAIWAILDQVAVSGTGFLSSVAIGRSCGADALGIYTMSLSVALIATSTQDALVSSPLTVLGVRLEDPEKRNLTGSAIVHAIGMASVFLFLLLLCAMVGQSASSPTWLGSWSLVMMLVVPATLLRQFFRKLAFIQGHLSRAVVIDFAVLTSQIGLLLYLIRSDLLTSFSGVASVALSCALGGILGLLWYTCEFRFRPDQWIRHFQQSWSIGKWVLTSRWMAVLHANGILWIMGWMRGVEQVGILAACISVVSVSNLLIFGMANLLEPHFARVYSRHGVEGLVASERSATRWIAFSMALFISVLILFGETFVTWLYNQNVFHGSRALIAFLSLAFFADALGLGPNQYLRVVGRMRANVRASAIGLVATCALAPVLIAAWESTGAAAALMMGYVITTILRRHALTLQDAFGHPSVASPPA